MEKSPGVFSRHPLAILFGLFLIAYISVFAMFSREGHPHSQSEGIDANALPFSVHLLNVDLARGTATFTLQPDLASPALASKGRLNEEIAVEVDTGTLVLAHKFKKHDSPGPWSVTVPIDDGDVLDYPFDQHHGSFLVQVKSESHPAAQANLQMDKIMHGFVATAHSEALEDKTQIEMSFQIKRSPAVIFLALMAMLALTLIVLSAVVVAKHVAINGRKVEFSMLVWIAALLFVIPSVRNGLPGSPPFGALVDIALFFWLQIIGVGALLAVVSRWRNSA